MLLRQVGHRQVAKHETGLCRLLRTQGLEVVQTHLTLAAQPRLEEVDSLPTTA